MPASTAWSDAAATEADPRWAAFTARDTTADDSFVAAVLTTGIYCRASCPARRPRPENVRFFPDGSAAARAGFRPCKRCRPDAPGRAAAQRDLVVRACRSLADAADTPDLAALARAAGLSRFHFHRVFRTVTGVTPKAYATTARRDRLRDALAKPDTSVTAAIHDAGFGANGRFYAEAEAALGMTVTTFRRGGAGTTIRFATGPCSLGIVLAAASPAGVCAILLGDDPATLAADLRARFPEAELIGDDPGFTATLDAVVGHVEAPRGSLALPLDVAGTAFQRQVWDALRAIPAGETVTYAALAARIGRPKASRAVAGACAANRLAVAIPCHRVVHGSGAAAGYRWGVERKRTLLDREAGA